MGHTAGRTNGPIEGLLGVELVPFVGPLA